MTASKPRKSEEKSLKATVKKLRSRLEKADADAKRWKNEAGRLKEAHALSERQVKKLSKRLEKASRTEGPSEPAPSREVASPVDSATTAGAAPNASWTVPQLRAEARSRGLTGMSRKSKAELLTALR